MSTAVLQVVGTIITLSGGGAGIWKFALWTAKHDAQLISVFQRLYMIEKHLGISADDDNTTPKESTPDDNPSPGNHG